jgi:hypothetical protein
MKNSENSQSDGIIAAGSNNKTLFVSSLDPTNSQTDFSSGLSIVLLDFVCMFLILVSLFLERDSRVRI